ncbi:hypothetical protein IGI04_026341 [Brassica rapa subsp. trilocularis]|uniref:F-box associated beta-propeller type 1 domain-containing protein n=1 Tax=Brassica rapa subsp. trilocularis TaxID=1813537 RepID=A0ABQ7KVZ5_BRACM|nr:hypothetical protein IGI04_026341 [Brassica rapa subsp. trilocularis]
MDWGNLPGEMIEDISHGVFLVKINLHDASPSVKVAYQFNLKDPDCNSSQVAAIRKGIKPRDRYKKHDYYALGYNNKNQKILPIKNKYEIYDFTFDSWRVLGVTTDWFLAKYRRGGISFKGNTYWVATWSHTDFLKF